MWFSDIESIRALLKGQRIGAFGNTIKITQMPFGLIPKVTHLNYRTALGINHFMVKVIFSCWYTPREQRFISTARIRKHKLAEESFLRMIGNNSAGTQLAIIWESTLPAHFQLPKTANFSAAPLPLIPLRQPSKYESSISTDPSNASNIFCFCSWYSAINPRGFFPRHRQAPWVVGRLVHSAPQPRHCLVP